MESELVAGLCEMWFTLSRWSWKALSWAIGLILYKNNDLTSVIGIVSNLYRKRIKYENKLMNPFKGSLRHKIIEIININLQLFDNYYIWTSKIMNPTERLAPYINKKLSKRNNIFLIESGNSIFKYNLINCTYELGETIARGNSWITIASVTSGKEEIIKSLLNGCEYNLYNILNMNIIRSINTGEILLEMISSVCETLFRGVGDEWISVLEITCLLGYCFNLIIKLLSRIEFYKLNYSESDSNYVIFKPDTQNFFICSSNTNNSNINSDTHLSHLSLNGINNKNIILENINLSNDRKYRKLSSFLYNPYFLLKAYNNLKDLNLINEVVEWDWFVSTSYLLKSGEYNPQKIKKQLINNKIIIIEDVRDRIVCEAIRLILYHIYIDKNYNGLDHAFGKNRSWHTGLQFIKNEWSDLSWFISFNYDKTFLPIHRKLILSQIKKDVQDQRLFDILNKLFNSGLISLVYYKTFNRYKLPANDLLSILLIYIFFCPLYSEILKIKNNIIKNRNNDNVNNNSNLRFVGYIDSFLLAFKGPKKDVLNIKKRLEVFFSSNLHIKIQDNSLNLINILSDNLVFLNVILSSKLKYSSLLVKKRSNIIQQRKKGIILKNNRNETSLKKWVKLKNTKLIKTYINLIKKKILLKSDKNMYNVNNGNKNFFNSVKESLSENFLDINQKNSFQSTISLLNKSIEKNKINNNEINSNIFSKYSKKYLNNRSKYNNSRIIINKNERSIIINANIKNTKKVLFQTGLVNIKGKPIAWRILLNNKPSSIIILYNNISNFLLSTFSCCDNYSNVKALVNYNIKWSLLHTLAAKHRTTINQVSNKLYPNLIYMDQISSIQFLTSQDINRRKKKYHIYSSPFFKDIDWFNDNLNLRSLFLSKKSDLRFNFNSNKYCLKQLNTNNKRFFSTCTYRVLNNNGDEYAKTKDLLLTKKIEINPFFLEEDRLFDIETFNISYLLENFFLFTERISQNKGLFWPPNKNEELNEEEFLYWFSGFFDAEGYFSINLNSKVFYKHSFRLGINLHCDDLPLLQYIQRRLNNIGRINVRKKENAARFDVRSIEDIKYIITIFDKYPLWTHKQLDFNDFKLAFNLRIKYFSEFDINLSKSHSLIKKFYIDSLDEIIVYKNQMNAKRTVFSNYVKPDYKKIHPYWLIGFVEGDGGFWITRGKTVFGLGQKNGIILEEIGKYLNYVTRKERLNLYKKSSMELFSPPSIVRNFLLFKKSERSLCEITYTDQDVIFQEIAPFFAKRLLLSRKGYDFYIWLICLHLIIHGYQKLPEGRTLLLKLRHNMNTARYSHKADVNFEFASLTNLIKLVFSQKPPFDIYTGLSHRKLAIQKIHRRKSSLIYVYMKKKGVLGSPFQNATDAYNKLNISFESIREYIDTDIEVKGYLLYSNPKFVEIIK